MIEAEKIKIINDTGSRSKDVWTPTVGEETVALKKRMENPSGEDKEVLFREAFDVFKHSGSPNLKEYDNTGIVIGYVQSGKTTSFTALAALAKDNRYCAVIVISGTAKHLSEQTRDRLKEHLLGNRTNRGWLVSYNPSRTDENNLRMIFQEWGDDNLPHDMRRTALIVVMKNAAHLKSLQSILDSFRKEDILSQRPVLIIDDEGDQASLNTRASKMDKKEFFDGSVSEEEMSSIYKEIIKIKRLLLHRTFIQYTATPQAPLFIHRNDNLSPNFVNLLSPGQDYVGGRDIFQEGSGLVVTIPQSDTEAHGEVASEDPPESLQSAMRIFFIGVAAGLKKKDTDNRSMMVHPSRLTGRHDTYYFWVTNIKNSWERLLASKDEGDTDRNDLIEEFRLTYGDLAKTVGSDIPDFNEFIASGFLLHAMKNIQIIKVNSKRDYAAINWKEKWKDHYAFILVGGQSMDRGFTIEGLTVTYMPRKLGVGNADTIQQRARFLGYKKKYLGYCRIFIDDISKNAYERYVEHEEDLRKRLGEHIASGKPLKDWIRVVELSKDLKHVTRSNVLAEQPERETDLSGEWTKFNIPHDPAVIIANNKKTVTFFINFLEVNATRENQGMVGIKNSLYIAKLKSVQEVLIEKLKFGSREDESSSAIKKAIDKQLATNPEVECGVYIMDNGESRQRSLDGKGAIVRFFQGHNNTYAGDEKTKISDEKFTIQIHILDIFKDSKKEPPALYEGVPSIAVWTPKTKVRSLIKQHK